MCYQTATPYNTMNYYFVNNNLKLHVCRVMMVEIDRHYILFSQHILAKPILRLFYIEAHTICIHIFS